MKRAKEWYFPRRTEASRMLFTLRHTRKEPLWFVSSRSTGKTTFLQKDFSRMAENASEPTLPVYIPLGADRENPLQVIQGALDKALAELKSSPWGRILSTFNSEVEEVGADEFHVKFRAQERTEPVPSLYLKLDRTIDEVMKLSKKPVVLIFDDAHYLLGTPQTGTLCTCLRAMISSRAGQLNAVFALDSRKAADSLFVKPGAPFHQFGRESRFPPMGQDFVDHMSALYASETGRKLDLAEMRCAFERLNGQPRAFMSVLADMMADQLPSPAPYIERALAEMHAEGDWSAWHDGMSPLEKLILTRLADGLDPNSDAARLQYAAETQRSFVPRRTVGRVLEGLVEKQVLGRAGQSYGFLSDEYCAWIRERTLCSGIEHAPESIPSELEGWTTARLELGFP